MTPHKATPEQWAELEEWATKYEWSSCVVELRDRLAALEAAANLQQQGEDAERAMEGAPAGGLVERVTKAVNKTTICERDGIASAAILAVAEWFDAIGYGATASILRQEVKQNG
jgi:hypothetical protein